MKTPTATLDNARAAFAAGPPPYLTAADILARIAANQRARYFPTMRGDVAREDWRSRARDAGREAAASWQPRDRRAGFDVFKQYIFDAVDTVLRKVTVPQGVATRNPSRGHNQKRNKFGGLDTRENKAFDVAAAADDAVEMRLVAPSGEQPADADTLEAFKLEHRDEHKLATAVKPYTNVEPDRYAQQCRPKSKGYTDADRAMFEREVRNAATMLRLFAELRVPSSALDFRGVAPPPAHLVAMGLAHLILPGRPPVGDELIGPWAKTGVLIPAAFIERDKNGDPWAVRYKEDGQLQPEARRYFAKLLRWALPISEYFVEADQRARAVVVLKADAAERLRQLVDTMTPEERELARVRLTGTKREIDAAERKYMQAKSLKAKASTRKS